MIVYICFTLVLVNANSYKYLHVLSSPYMYSKHGGLNNYVASITEMPYHVLVVYSNLYCSGSLLRSKVIVTAASCFLKWQSQKVVVKVGADTVTGMGQVIEVVAVKKHEYFGHRNELDNDIALLMLKDHVKFSPQVKKILMVEPNTALQVGTPLNVSGWASSGCLYGLKWNYRFIMEFASPRDYRNFFLTLEPLKYANSLQWSEMMLLPAHDCTKFFPNTMTRSNLCAKYSPERRISDNGGPVVSRELLIGVLSFGADSSVEPYVAVMTNVSYFHRWINLNIKRFLKKYCVEPVHYHARPNPDSYDIIETWR